MMDLMRALWILFQTSADKDKIGKIAYYPHNGIQTKYFPYLQQEIYQDPLLFVKFKDIAVGESVAVKCELWSSNIDEDSRDRAAAIFTLYRQWQCRIWMKQNGSVLMTGRKRNTNQFPKEHWV